MRRGTTPRRPQPQEAQADINVTPLVDVCLVLLIIFMVVTPLIREGVPLALPETGRPDTIPERAGQIVVAVDREGSVFVNEGLEPADRLLATLRSLAATDPTRDVVVRGDRRLPYATVRAVMKLINEAGFGRASLVTLRRGQATSS